MKSGREGLIIIKQCSYKCFTKHNERDADNQRHIDAECKQWGRQDNRSWNALQNKADLRHKAIAVNNALQGQNKVLSDTLRAEVKKAWNNRYDNKNGERRKTSNILFLT
ncbi:hypothetical protein [Bartonella harrusi]|uniref:Uncharacterized protein n=1 Tax=Bartonella harrusi TaxID=2961895 RepID=A0ABY5ES06_9HYPH|nr:hypothetical protein [Bartonella harrusi]UTO28047.1 hypothetical protein NMK50_07520 [Bartonella harrusi]